MMIQLLCSTTGLMSKQSKYDVNSKAHYIIHSRQRFPHLSTTSRDLTRFFMYYSHEISRFKMQFLACCSFYKTFNTLYSDGFFHT